MRNKSLLLVPSARRLYKRSFYTLFFDLFVHGLSPAPLAILFELYFTGYQLLIFAGPIVDALAFAAGELDKAFL